jgi:thermitase
MILVFLLSTMAIAVPHGEPTESKVNGKGFSVNGQNTLSSAQLESGSRPKGWSDDSLKSSSSNSHDRLFTFETPDETRISDSGSDELIIGLDDAKTESYARIVDEVSRSHGKIVDTISVEGRITAVVAYVPPVDAASFTAKIQTASLVKYVESNRLFQAQFVPDDPFWSMQWGPQRIEADKAWDTTTGNHSVLVAVVDTGIDYTHPDIAANYVPLGYDWVNNDADPMDDYGHGTHCAGIIAAVINNSVGMAGIANVSVMAEKGLNSEGMGYEDWLAKAIIHAVDEGANIISMSWGGSSDSSLIHSAIQYAYNHGVLLLASAGNSGNTQPGYPAYYEEVDAVVATDQNDTLASFSTHGDWVSLAAPGVDIYSAVPGGYASHSGTSMACPHAVGVAALIWSQFPNATRDWVRGRLRCTTDDLGDPSFDDVYGYGRVNARKALEQVQPDHELLITHFSKPRAIHTGETVSINATVENWGTDDEHNVVVQLIVDGNVADSQVLGDFSSMAASIAQLWWSPTAEGIFNVTLYIVPVSGEANTDDNVMMKDVLVIPLIGYVLVDAFRGLAMGYEETWMGDLLDIGYGVNYNSEDTVTPDMLAHCDVFIVSAAKYMYRPDELLTIQDYVQNGGGLLLLGSSNWFTYSAITRFAGLPWANVTGTWWGGETTNVTQHQITEGVQEVYVSPILPRSRIVPTPPGVGIVRDSVGLNEVEVAVSEVQAGRVVCVSDVNMFSDACITYSNNRRLASNIVDWLARVKHEHEVVVRIETPTNVEPGEEAVLNATVSNFGLANETDIEFKLQIDDLTVYDSTIPELDVGTEYALHFLWNAPNAVTICNITAYASVVPDEYVTLNNVKMREVNVHFPIINPVPGQYAEYIWNGYWPLDRLLTTGYYNFTYDYYVEPHKIHVTVQHGVAGASTTEWLIIDTLSRLVEHGSWQGLYYPEWIESTVDLGSTVNLLWTSATVSASGVFKNVIDYWDIPYTEWQYSNPIWCDKTSGLTLKQETIYLDICHELILADTNIPIGTGIHDVAAKLTSSKTVAGQNYAVSFNASVENQGVYPETAKVTIYINSTAVTSQTLELGIGDHGKVSFTWNTTGFAKGNYNVTAYVAPVLNEADTADNTVTSWIIVTVPGDVSGQTFGVPDGRVDMRDIGAICNNFMSTPSSPEWNPNLDVNDDGVVNMREIGIACSSFMKT